MQIKVALCDDETGFHKTTEKLLTEYKQQNPSVSFAFSCFSSGKDMLDYIDANQTFDIYILDIVMPGINGIQLGAALREQGDDGLIIYLTVSPLISRPDFLIVGSSFAVNLYYVTEVTKSDMLLKGDHHVPIPRRVHETVKSKWADYWLNKGEIHTI